ncbi:hypothetical protein [Promicromonospora soli]|nr:hypothetical protein [Promicromonospora soli]
MSTEFILSPLSESVRVVLTDAPAWSAYAAELRGVLDMVIEKSGSDFLEVGELLVSQPLPDRYMSLRNGVEVSRSEAIDLIEGMVAGRGPYCRLSIPGKLCIESGWDGGVHLYATPVVSADLMAFRSRDVSLQWRNAVPEFVDVSRPVDAVADEKFWHAVLKASERTTLLCERWAHGAYGCRWFRVTQGNAMEVARLVRPRSLLCVVSEPDLQPKSEVMEEDFTAFAAPLLPGELAYQAYPGGADSLSDVIGQGFSFILADKALSNWCAVVPDPDGVMRGQWESPGES